MKTIGSSHSLPFYKVNIHLSLEAQDYLSETTDGIGHFAILNQLIKMTAVFPTTTTKRGNVIKLKSGQVECSVHSFCQSMSLGRKAMERIIRNFERLRIIRLHRSRLATIADMLCISEWQLNDDTTVFNKILLDSPDHLTGEQASLKKVSAADVTTEAKTQSLADTVASASHVPSAFPQPTGSNGDSASILDTPKSHMAFLKDTPRGSSATCRRD